MSLLPKKPWEQIQPAVVVGSAAPRISLAAPAPAFSLATFADRTQAHIMDMFIIQGVSLSAAKLGALAFLALLQNFYGVRGSGNAVVLRAIYDYSFWSIWAVAFGLTSLCYFVTLTHLHGKTFGQAFWGIHVLGLDGKKLSFSASLKRYGLGVVSYLSLGVLYRLGVLDRWSQSVVTTKNQNPA